MAPTSHSRPGRSRRRIIVASVCLVAVLGAGGASWALLSGQPTAASAADEDTTSEHRSTSPVTRGDLTESNIFAGTLGYGAPVGVPAAASGTITWLPDPGQVIHRDEPLYAVDEEPVRAMYGTVPLWRTLEFGDRGQDVAQLNRNLAALGYGVVEDDRFGKRTLAGVRQWQKDRHRTVTGTIGADDIAFVDGDVRVAKVDGTLGQTVGSGGGGDAGGEAGGGSAGGSGGNVISVTSTSRVVDTTVGQQDADRLAVGAEVSVRINGGGDALPGKVVATEPVEDDNGGAPKVRATIAIEAGDRQLPAAATAQIIVAGRSERDVLSVPVAALVAHGSDGYAVDVVRHGDTERVPVEAGFVANGRVAVTGDVREGDQVVVPS
ncbi:peptidoglycan-binding protein [Curtobacterium sp. RHCJP20]|uniref:Peptidoglycan-binding protein n=1 Tax=Curtobacterium subtropicum TaxID=3055138 RepID=A0ABT7TJG0_9MICO|nr:peptidoglycan-binding protein [Curtobacterium subtropicum]MDM7889734.1 peptidoglycan-binding protein [Curtobacterium subtropicum]